MDHVTVKTPYISEYCDFDFYDFVWYHPGLNNNFKDEIRNLGRWLGVSHRIGNVICDLILTKSGKVIEETNIQHDTGDDMIDIYTVAQVENINTDINERLDDTKVSDQKQKEPIHLRR